MTTQIQDLRRLDLILDRLYLPASAVEFDLVMRDFLWANPGLEYEYPFLPDGYEPVFPQTLGGRGINFGTDDTPPVQGSPSQGGGATLDEVLALLGVHKSDSTAHHTPPSTATVSYTHLTLPTTPYV